MRDCDDVTMRERLPDLLHGQLGAADQAAVLAHVAACEECRAELEVLRAVRHELLAAPVTPVNVERVVSRLPAYRRRSFLARAVRAPAFQVAAAVVLLAGGAAAVLDRADTRPDTLVASAVPSGELAVGTLTDISDADLEVLLAELSRLEPVPSGEPDVVVVPAVRGGGE
jgi:anti-sigma factor RsiW